MNTQEELKKTRAELDSIQALEKKLKESQDAKLEYLALLIRTSIKEEGLLGNCDWTMTLNGRGGFSLHTDIRDPGVKVLLDQLNDVINGGFYHFRFELLEGDGTIYFDDSDVHMSFENTKSLSKLCEDYKIKFDVESIDKYIEEHTEKTNRFKEIRKTVKKYIK